MAICLSSLTTALFLACVCIVTLLPSVDAAVGGRWHPRRWSGIGNNRLHGRHAAGRRHRQDRPCFICPGSSVVNMDLYHGEADDHANDAVENGHVPRFSVRMPEPVVRPCLYPNQKQLSQPSVTTQVVRGPQPGTPLSEGLHRIVLRVVYQDESNDLTDSSHLHPHKQHAYCRYTIKVVRSLDDEEGEREELRLCQPPPLPDHGKVTCKSVGDDVTVMSCRYSCDEGYVTPRSERHLLLQDWNCLSNSSQAPSCIKLEAPVPIDSAQCSGLNLTVAESDDVHLPLPQFIQTSTSLKVAPLKGASGEVIRIDCDVNSLKAPSKAQLSSGEGSAVIVKRFCAARNTETDATFNCTYDVQLNVDPAPERSVMVAELRFQIGQKVPPSVPGEITDMAASFWCDDVVLVERLMLTAKDRLFAANSEACRIANCTKFTTKCLHTVKLDHSNSTSTGIEERESLLDVTWTVTTDYKPFSYEDYFYEGAEVPEGEMLIEKIKAETETMIEGDLGLRREMETAGGRLLYQSFRLAKLDLICPLPGYVVNASINQCQKCPENSYQLKGTCQPCPEGTYQERPGQTECWPCSRRTKEPSLHYAGRCQKRRREVAGHHHPAIAVLLANKHLIRNKSHHSNGAKGGNTSISKLGQTAAAVSSSASYHSRNDPHPFKAKVSKKSHKKLQLPSSKTRRNLAEYYPATGGETMSVGLRKTKAQSNETVPSAEEDPCWPNPCLAGGTCFQTMRLDDKNNLVPHFKCSCRPGATGSHCETPYCPALYCFNGGTCIINHQRFGPGPESRELVSCECPSGFTGRRCEHRRRRPATPLAQESNKIRHQRRRHEQLFKETVDGASNITNSGNSKELMGVHCASNPCHNGGRCVDNSHAAPAPGFFTCICPPKYQGELCDYMPCPTSVGRTACPQPSSASDDIRYSTSRASGRKRSQQERCLIHTPTGRRECAPVKIINQKIRHQHAP